MHIIHGITRLWLYAIVSLEAMMQTLRNSVQLITVEMDFV